MKSLLQKFIIFFVFGNILFAQIIPQAVMNQIQLNSTSTFKEVQSAMNEYWTSLDVQDGYVMENGIRTKLAGWKLYKRWEYYWEQRANIQTGEFPQTNSVIEYDKYLSANKGLKKETIYNESWVNLGTNTSAGGYAGIGRINCVAFHPTDDNTILVGSPSGGLWKTTDGGSSWAILNDNQLVLGVSDIAITNDYSTSNTLYIATGDRDGGSMWSLNGGQAADNISIGVLKSTDGGTTWNTTGLSIQKGSGKKIFRLLIDPTNNLILLASTSDGIYKTTDGGANWTYKTPNQWIDMEFNPADHNIICASSFGYTSSYINRSTDNGETWSYYLVASGGYRSDMAVSVNDPAIIYMLSCNSSGGLLGVYKSTNSGASFTRVVGGTKAMLGYYSDGSGSNTGQGGYDLCIAVSPTDVNIVYVGGINTWKSTDGGVNWAINNMWTTSAYYNKSGAPVVHADKHILAFQNSSTLFEGNDGGIYKTTNGGTNWTDLTNGIVISQIYRIGVSQTDANVILTGLQDNGSKKYIGGISNWFDATGGDGMECIIDFNNATSYMYSTYVNGTIYRNTNGFSNGNVITISANIPGGQPTGAWVTPYIMHPTNSTILFAGYDKVWKTTNRGDTWSSASQYLSSTYKLRSLAIALSDANVLYAADPSHLWKTTDGGTTNWSSVALPVATTYLTYIAVKNTDPNTVWITYGGYTDGSKVYESTNGGASWTNISSGLPNLPVMSIVQYKSAIDRNVLFVGTDVGVYVKDGTNSWASFNTGLPNVVVTELEIFYSGGSTLNRLRAGTFGRGLWETEISAALPVELSTFAASYKNNSIFLNWTTETEVNNYGFEIERKNNNIQTSKWKKIGFQAGNGNSNSPHNYDYKDRNINYGTYLYRLKQIDNNGQYTYSKEVEIELVNPTTFALTQNYPNPFNPTTTIKYAIPQQAVVSLSISDLLGREVAVLVNEDKPAGRYEIIFNASNLSSGIYFYRIIAGEFIQTKKLLLIK